MTTTLNIRRAADRFHTQISWLDSWHSFSFGRHFDPDNVGYRSLRVINDDVIAPGGGFGEHGHDNMEIISWMIDGALKHGDSLGNMRTLSRGEVQVMSAGSGIRHSEFNASDNESAHLLQIWIEPAKRDITPRYDQRAFDEGGRRNRWQTLVSGRGVEGAMPIEQDADLRVATLDDGAQVVAEVAAERHGYLHVAFGRVEVDGQAFGPGDALTFDGPAALPVLAAGEAEVVLFDLS